MLFSLHAKNRIFFINHPVLTNSETPSFDIHSGVLTPKLPKETSVFERKDQLLKLIKDFIATHDLHSYHILTDTCRAVPYLRHLQPKLVIYDQNDEEAKIYPELFIEMAEYAD